MYLSHGWSTWFEDDIYHFYSRRLTVTWPPHAFTYFPQWKDLIHHLILHQKKNNLKFQKNLSVHVYSFMFECVRKVQSCRQETAIMTKWRASGRHPLHEHTADESRSFAGRWLQNSSTFLIRLRLSGAATDKGKASVCDTSYHNKPAELCNQLQSVSAIVHVGVGIVCVWFFLYFSSLCRRAGLQKKADKEQKSSNTNMWDTSHRDGRPSAELM